ncbi:hypothetical protein [Streptosporangium subroseum]|uniref:hypothetical protein n=1 Tax=Streptosporangium subroseum TaxID=106412 RepID=UPI0030882517|nr:hypothetical protein OHB15_22830 [Streptosporangium subroseum]
MIAKRTTAAPTVCATASSLGLAALPVLPAGAAADGEHGWASAHRPRKVTK